MVSFARAGTVLIVVQPFNLCVRQTGQTDYTVEMDGVNGTNTAKDRSAALLMRPCDTPPHGNWRWRFAVLLRSCVERR